MKYIPGVNGKKETNFCLNPSESQSIDGRKKFIMEIFY